MFKQKSNYAEDVKVMNSDTEEVQGKKNTQKRNYKPNCSFNANFDERVSSIYSIFDKAYPISNKNIKLGFSLCSGSPLGISHTIIIRGFNLENRTKTIDTILAPIDPSLTCTIYGNLKGELSRIKSTHKILRVSNFQKNFELITLLTKANKEGIVYKGFKIHKMTVITDSLFNKIPEELRNNSIIIEACDSYIKPKSIKKTPFTYVEEAKWQESLKRDCEEAIEFINSLNQLVKVDISTKNCIESKINNFFPRDTYYHKVFFDLVKIITFLNQHKRKSYTIITDKNIPEQLVVISEVEDAKLCFEIVNDVFVKNSLDMPYRYLEMLNFIIGWLSNDPIIRESKTIKNIPEAWDDYFEGMALIKDYRTYLEFHKDKSALMRNERRFREYLLNLSDHREKGKYKCLHLMQEGNKNKFKLINAPLVKFFQFPKEDDEFYEEYVDFLQYIRGKSEEFSLKLNFDDQI